jgi:hypothetical protein
MSNQQLIGVQVSPVSFQAVLNHPIALSHFRRYLVSIHAQENLDFYWAVKYFPRPKDQVIRSYKQQWARRGSALIARRSDVDDNLGEQSEDDDDDIRLDTPSFDSSDDDDTLGFTRARIINILKEFVVDGAPSQINIHSDTHKKLKAILKESSGVVNDRSLLDTACDEVYGILCTDSFPRFVSSPDAFGEMVRSVIHGDTELLFTSPSGSYKAMSPTRTVGSITRPGTPSLTAGRKFFLTSTSSTQQQSNPKDMMDFGSL